MEHDWKFWHDNHPYPADYCTKCNMKSFMCEKVRLYYYHPTNIGFVCIGENDNPGVNGMSCEEYIIKNIIE